MALVTPIDVIKGLSGKYGSGSSDYFATNTSSNRIRLAKYLNKPMGDPTPSQKAQMEKFAIQAKMASAWLRANHPSDVNGDKGTEAYQEAQAIKRQLHLSNVRQVVIKFMDAEGNVTLPSTGTTNGGAIDNGGSGSGGSGGNDGGSGDSGSGGSSSGDSGSGGTSGGGSGSELPDYE